MNNDTSARDTDADGDGAIIGDPGLIDSKFTGYGTDYRSTGTKPETVAETESDPTDGDNTAVYVCLFCDHPPFDSEHEYTSHLADEHPDRKFPDEYESRVSLAETTYPCPYDSCSASFAGTNALKKRATHLADEHTDPDGADPIATDGTAVSSSPATDSSVARLSEVGQTILSFFSAKNDGPVYSFGKYTLDIEGFRTKRDDETIGGTTLLSTGRERVAFAIGLFGMLAFIVATLVSMESVARGVGALGTALTVARSTQRALDAKGSPTRKRLQYAAAEPLTALLGAVTGAVGVMIGTVASMWLFTDIPASRLVDWFFQFARFGARVVPVPLEAR